MKHEPNPKKLMGDKKPPLHLLPLAGMIHQALAHLDGDLKYGFENWNDRPVEKLTYIGAAIRHLQLYKYGETNARDTNVHNLGGVMACCAILLDAELNGNLIDNARHSKATCDLLHNAEAIVAVLKDQQANRVTAKEALERAEQARKDQSWADAAIKFDPPFSVDWTTNAVRLAEGLLVSDAGGDAPVDDAPFKTCGKCQNLLTCNQVGHCCYPQTTVLPEFKTCLGCEYEKCCTMDKECYNSHYERRKTSVTFSEIISGR